MVALFAVFHAMNAARPAARSADAFGKFRPCSYYPPLSSFDELGGFNPTYPFVAGEWRDVQPCGSGGAIFRKLAVQVFGYARVNGAGGEVSSSHASSIAGLLFLGNAYAIIEA